MSVAWVVVADSSQARIFSAEKSTSSLEEIHTLNHPEVDCIRVTWSPTVPAGIEMLAQAVTTWAMKPMQKMKQQPVLQHKWGKLWSVAAPTADSTNSMLSHLQVFSACYENSRAAPCRRW